MWINSVDKAKQVFLLWKEGLHNALKGYSKNPVMSICVCGRSLLMCECCGKEKPRDYKQEMLRKLLNESIGKEGALIPVLQEAQEIYGYLSEELMTEIGLALNIHLSKVYGVATFYAQFHFASRGRNIIKVCMGTACHVRGGDKILEKTEEVLKIKNGETTPDLKFTIDAVACIGACGLAPVMTINGDTYGRLTPDSVAKLLEQY